MAAYTSNPYMSAHGEAFGRNNPQPVAQPQPTPFKAYQPAVDAGMQAQQSMAQGATEQGYDNRIGGILQNQDFQSLLGEQRGALDQNLAAGGMRRSGYGLQQQANLPMQLAQSVEGIQAGRESDLVGMGQRALAGQRGIIEDDRMAAQRTRDEAKQRSNDRRARNMAALQGLVGIGAAVFSDVRLKKALYFIGKINGVKMYTWTWNSIAEKELGLSGQNCGVIAQEVRKTHPKAVTENGKWLQVDMRKIFK